MYECYLNYISVECMTNFKIHNIYIIKIALAMWVLMAIDVKVNRQGIQLLCNCIRKLHFLPKSPTDIILKCSYIFKLTLKVNNQKYIQVVYNYCV